jgi:hypothetical protein
LAAVSAERAVRMRAGGYDPPGRIPIQPRIKITPMAAIKNTASEGSWFIQSRVLVNILQLYRIVRLTRY